jgi:Holliday junction DNA helicase RuvB
VRDYADVNGDGVIDAITTTKALEMMEIDSLGLDPADRKVLITLIERHQGGPVGVETLAALTGDERTTIEDFFEPYLMQVGLLERTPRGRKATRLAYEHFDIPINPKSDQTKLV